MIKVTFTLDDETVASLGRTAERLGMPKSLVVREAIRAYAEQMSRLTDEERERMLDAFDRVIPSIPDRPRSEVETELAEVRRARKSGETRGERGARHIVTQLDTSVLIEMLGAEVDAR